MLQLATPLALAGLLGRLVPLLIHLWERRKAERVKVGSIRWLEASKDARVSRIRFTDFWRFLLRAVIVALFVLLLAGPYWQADKPGKQESRWVLLDPLAQGEEALIPLMDSLQYADIPVKWATAGIPERIAGSASPVEKAGPIWSLLQDLAHSGVYPDTITVFTFSRLSGFHGERPALPFRVEWNIIPPPGPEFQIANAWNEEGQVRLMVRENDSEATRFQTFKIPRNEGRHEIGTDLPAATLSQVLEPGQNASWEVSLGQSGNEVLRVGEVPLRNVVLGYDEGFSESLPYWQAALQAVGRYLALPIEINTVNVSEGEVPRSGDVESGKEYENWLFWFSADSIPTELYDNYSPNILLIDQSFPKTGHISFKGMHWARQDAIAQHAGLPAITDSELPEQILQILFGNLGEEHASQDKRILAANQAEPVDLADTKGFSNVKNLPETSLFFAGWLFLLSLLLLERLTAKI